LKKISGYFPIAAKEKISRSIFKLVFRSPEIAGCAKPGQFVQIRTSDDYFPLWPRPFSIYDVDLDRGEFSVIFKIFGCGTSQLAEIPEGKKIHILGPLGKGFDLLSGDKKVILAAGGIGLPPLHFLARKSIDSIFPVEKITFISGARSKMEHFDDGRLADLGVDLRICTDDGSLGTRGTVVDLLEGLIKKDGKQMVYACGPSAMLEKVDAVLTSRKISGLLSLEALMPCGLGICSGCAIKTIPSAGRGLTDDRRDYHLKRVCVDGPVFRTGEVIWR